MFDPHLGKRRVLGASGARAACRAAFDSVCLLFGILSRKTGVQLAFLEGPRSRKETLGKTFA